MISYEYRMPRRAISLTLDGDNITWLKGRAGATGVRSVSELVDRLVTAARQGGRGGPTRSVVGTIDIDASDPLLEAADEAVRSMYGRSLGRPIVAREARAGHAPRQGGAKSVRG